MSFGCYGIKLGGTIAANTMLRRYAGLIKFMAFGTYRFLVGFREQWKTTFGPLCSLLRVSPSPPRDTQTSTVPRLDSGDHKTHGFCRFVRPSKNRRMYIMYVPWRNHISSCLVVYAYNIIGTECCRACRKIKTSFGNDPRKSIAAPTGGSHTRVRTKMILNSEAESCNRFNII